jgi:hypothetical protein
MLPRFAQRKGVSAISAQSVAKMLHLHPWKINMVQKLHGTDRAARLNFVNWYLRGVYSVEIQPTILFSDDSRFLLSGYVKYPNLMLIHKMPLHGFKVVVPYSVSVNRITRGIFFWGHNFAPTCYTYFDAKFWTPVRLRENLYLLSVRKFNST